MEADNETRDVEFLRKYRRIRTEIRNNETDS